MKCPRCVQRIHRAAASCPHCGFTLADADLRFGAEEVRIGRLTDGAGILRRGEREQVAAALDRVTQRFPQVFVAIYTGALGEVSNIRQFGFWLLNRSAFEDVPVNLPNEAGILITIDPESKAAGMVFGYLLDPFLEEADTFACLSRAHAYWLEGHYADGIVRLLGHLESVLLKRSQQAKKDPEYFERKVVPPPRLGEMVRRIREGHRPNAEIGQEPDKAVTK